MKALLSLIASTAVLVSAGTVSAQSFSPAGAFSGSGNVTLYNSQSVNCDVDISGSVGSATTASISGRTFSAGSFLCGWVVSPAGAWQAVTVPGDASKVWLFLGANTIISGSCTGWVEADVVASPIAGYASRLIFNNDELRNPTPYGTGTGCYIESGYVDVTLSVI